jgi:hypothetical protein
MQGLMGFPTKDASHSQKLGEPAMDLDCENPERHRPTMSCRKGSKHLRGNRVVREKSVSNG